MQTRIGSHDFSSITEVFIYEYQRNKNIFFILKYVLKKQSVSHNTQPYNL